MRKQRKVAIKKWVEEYNKSAFFPFTKKDYPFIKEMLEAYTTVEIVEDTVILEQAVEYYGV